MLAQLEEKIMTQMDNDWKREKAEIVSMLSGSVRPLEFDVSSMFYMI